MTSDLAIATRIHLGQSSTPPPQSKLNQTISSFLTFCKQTKSSIPDRKIHCSIAVDAEEKIKGYDLVQAIKDAVEVSQTQTIEGEEEKNDASSVKVDIIQVSPWGKFIPALNALVSWAAEATTTTTKSTSAMEGTAAAAQPPPSSPLLLFISAETQLTPKSVEKLCSHVDSSTLVAGARLPGHDHKTATSTLEGGGGGGGEGKGGKGEDTINVVELNGCTSPWNTAAVWNLRKLSLLGFPLVAEGLIPNQDGSPGEGGVEETSCIGILQSILPPKTANAKLIDLKESGVTWNQTFDDEKRRKWHEHKMKSKLKRANRHMELLGLSGTVMHL